MSRIGVISFPGTNCDRDVAEMVSAKGHSLEWIFVHSEMNLKSLDGLIIPGGFSYGDYLRSGALAARTSVMSQVKAAAAFGVPVLGICNGFQILCEAGLLPGVLMQNEKGRFINQWCDLKLVTQPKGFSYAIANEFRLPVAHGDGRYFISADAKDQLFSNGQVFCCYQDNVNGSVDQIAGVMNKEKNVVGLMPHPERALFEWMGGTDGWGFL